VVAAVRQRWRRLWIGSGWSLNQYRFKRRCFTPIANNVMAA
jgi:hypothetical protein